MFRRDNRVPDARQAGDDELTEVDDVVQITLARITEDTSVVREIDF